MPKTIAELKSFMDQFETSLNSLVEGVSLAARDEVAELLAQYSQIVPECDERLQHCSTLLEKGLRDEALGYAIHDKALGYYGDEPLLLGDGDSKGVADLLDLKSRVSKEQWTRWQSALQKAGFPEPVMPKTNVVDELKHAIQCVTALKPLLDEWRRANLANAPLSKRIRTLRRLRSQDPNIPAWWDGLQTHETQRLMEIEAEVREAAATQHEEHLARLVSELQGEWLQPPPARIMKAAKSALRSLRDTRLDEDIEQTARALVDARNAGDLDAARTLAQRWHALVTEKGAFLGDDPRVARVGPVVEWVERHDRLAALIVEIDSGVDARPDASLKERRRWIYDLSRMKKEVGDLVEKLRDEIETRPIQTLLSRVTKREEQNAEEERWRRRRLYVIVTSAAAVVIGITALIVSIRDQERDVRTAVAAISDLVEKVRDGEIEPDLAGPPALGKGLLKDPAVAARVNELETAVAEERRRRSELVESQRRMTEMLDTLATKERLTGLEAWPTPFVDATKLIADIASGRLVKTPADKAGLERQTGLLQNVARRFERDGDESLGQRVAELTARLQSAREGVSAQDGSLPSVDDIEKEAVALRLLATAAPAPGAVGRFGEAKKVSWTALRPLEQDGQLMRAIVDAKKGLDQRQRLRMAERQLDGSLDTWPDYEKALRTLADGFPEMPIAKDYADAAKNAPLLRGVSEWNTFVRALKPYSELTPDRARPVLEEIAGLKASAGGLAFVTKFIDANEPLVSSFATRNLVEVEESLFDWTGREFLGELPWCIEAKEDPNDEAKPLTYYFYRGPQKKPGQAGFLYQRSMKPPNGQWPTPQKCDHEIIREFASPQKKLAEDLQKHCIDTLRGDGTRGVGLEKILLDALDRTLNAKNVDPILRLLTVRKLVRVGRDVSAFFRSPDTNELHDQLDDGNGGVPGILETELVEFLDPNREQNPSYVKAKRAAEQKLAHARRHVRNLQTQIEQVDKTLSHADVRGLLCIGRLARDAAGKLVLEPRAKPHMQPGSDLIVISGNGTPVKIGTCGKDGTAVLNASSSPAGVPVFVWEKRNGT